MEYVSLAGTLLKSVGRRSEVHSPHVDSPRHALGAFGALRIAAAPRDVYSAPPKITNQITNRQHSTRVDARHLWRWAEIAHGGTRGQTRVEMC